MGTGILASIKGLAPLLLYVLGAFLLFAALAGKVRWALLLVTLLLPLRNVVEKLQAYPFGTKFITILIIAMAIGWILSSMFQHQRLTIATPLNALLVTLIVYTFYSLQRGNSYLGYNTILDPSDPRAQDWKNFSMLPILFFITVNTLTDKKWIHHVFIVVCAAMLLMGYYTTSQVSSFGSLESRAKITGTFQFLGPNEVAAFYNQYTIILLSVFFFLKNKRHRLLLLGIILLNFYCMVFMYSRAAYAAALAGLVLLFAVKRKHFLIPLFLALIFWQVVLPEKAIERIQGTTNEYGELEISAERRLVVWRQAMNLFEDNPLLGVGYGVFRNLGLELGDTHNIYLKTMAEQGVAGLSILILILLFFLREGFRLWRNGDDDFSKGLGLGFMICIIVLVINNFFGDRWSYIELSGYFWIFAGMVSRLNIIALGEKVDTVDGRVEKKPEDKRMFRSSFGRLRGI